MHILLHEIGHLLIYSLLVFPIFLLDKNLLTKPNYLVGLVATILLDLDHFIDYFVYKGFGFSLREILLADYFIINQKVIVLFHSWELALFLSTVYLVQKRKSHKLLFVFIGITAHLVFDTFYYSFDLSDYFLIRRSFNSFSVSVFE